jgi:prepilin-type N-terminal cleavage/methylation domain-containing protein
MSPTFFNFITNRISKGAMVEQATPPNKGKTAAAFTLIELLVVIAIIGALAAIVLTIQGTAADSMRRSRIKAELGRLQTAIEDYKAAMGNYPPDNPDYNLPHYERCGKNSLFYELSGCTFDSGKFTTQNKAATVDASKLKTALAAKGVENSARNKKDIPWRGIGFKPNQYASLVSPNDDVDVLILPVDKGPHLLDGVGKKLNPWLYDASSTNRHNMETYDIWAEYAGKDGQTIVIGNW